MKKMRMLSFSFAAMMLASAGVSFAAGDSKGDIKFEETVYDFGIVKEKGGRVTCSFPFVNAGDGNLVIIDATAECGCTRPTYPKAPIAPGKSDTIKVTYNPLGRTGAFSKVVTVKTNGEKKNVHLQIRGNVVPDKQE